MGSFIHGKTECGPADFRAEVQPIHNCRLKCAAKGGAQLSPKENEMGRK